MSDNFSLQYLTIDRVIQAILMLGQGCFMAKTDREKLPSVNTLYIRMTGSYWGCNGRENTISIRSSHLG